MSEMFFVDKNFGTLPSEHDNTSYHSYSSAGAYVPGTELETVGIFGIPKDITVTYLLETIGIPRKYHCHLFLF